MALSRVRSFCGYALLPCAGRVPLAGVPPRRCSSSDFLSDHPPPKPPKTSIASLTFTFGIFFSFPTWLYEESPDPSTLGQLRITRPSQLEPDTAGAGGPIWALFVGRYWGHSYAGRRLLGRSGSGLRRSTI
jgi:hypothetical protein